MKIPEDIFRFEDAMRVPKPDDQLITPIPVMWDGEKWIRMAQVKDIELVIHLNLSKCGLLKKRGTLVWPGNALDGRTIYWEVETPKKKGGGYGEATELWYLDEKDAPTFPSAKDFYNHYK